MSPVPSIRSLLALALLLKGGAASAAVTTVDWFSLRAGATASSFVLEDDAGAAVATGSVAIASGFAFPGYPRERTFAEAGWSATIPFEHSVAGDGRVTGLDLRVVPQAGNADYRVEITLPAGRDFILAMGGLYRDATGATAAVAISWAGGGGPVSLETALAWTDSVNRYDTPLTWSPAAGTLSSDDEGNSSLAFLRLGAMPAPAILMLSIPNGYGAGTGDEISLAIGAVVPEPAAPALLATAALLAGIRRRRAVPA